MPTDRLSPTENFLPGMFTWCWQQTPMQTIPKDLLAKHESTCPFEETPFKTTFFPQC
jgi:hypothetical protein